MGVSPSLFMMYFLFLLTYFIGYLAGYLNGKHQDSIETIMDNMGKTTQVIKKRVKEIVVPTIKSGVIKNPTAKDLFNRKLPQHIKDGREAMKETLDAIPELAEHKKRLEEYNKSVEWTRG